MRWTLLKIKWLWVISRAVSINATNLILPDMPTDTSSSWTVLAHLLRPQGRKGEVLAELMTDFPESLTGREGLYLTPQSFEGAVGDAQEVRVSSSWLPVGKNKGRVVLQFDGVQSISDAESLAGMDLAIPSAKRLPLDEEASYISDLTGCIVYDNNVRVGEITNVQFPTTADGGRLDDVPSLLEVHSPDGAEILIPFVKSFVVSIDLESKKIEMKLPAGLIDVNR